MKYISNKSFQYPVLSPDSDDYINCQFQATLQFSEIKNVTDAPILRMHMELSDDSLRKLIAKGDAKYAVEVWCAKTFLRRIDTFSSGDFSLKFNCGDLHGKVEINPLIVCVKDVPNFYSNGFNKEFNRKHFDFKPGLVLATQPPELFYWDLEQSKPISSVFKLTQNSTIDCDTFGLSCEDDYVEIFVSPANYASFLQARNMRDKRPSLVMGVYFPVLVEVLRIMESQNGTESKKWSRCIADKLNQHNITLDKYSEFHVIAQTLLNNPLKHILPTIQD